LRANSENEKAVKKATINANNNACHISPCGAFSSGIHVAQPAIETSSIEMRRGRFTPSAFTVKHRSIPGFS
jgi:hypothetical protein